MPTSHPPIVVIVLLALSIGLFIGFVGGLRIGLWIAAARSPSPLTGVLCWIGAGFLLLITLFLGYDTIHFRLASQPGTATVIELKEHPDSRGEISYRPVYRYKVSDGKEYTEVSGSSGGDYKTGQVIPIRYLHDKPAESRIDTFASLWLVPLVSLGATVFSALFGWYFYWKAKRQLQALASAPSDSSAGSLPVQIE